MRFQGFPGVLRGATVVSGSFQGISGGSRKSQGRFRLSQEVTGGFRVVSGGFSDVSKRLETFSEIYWCFMGSRGLSHKISGGYYKVSEVLGV